MWFEVAYMDSKPQPDWGKTPQHETASNHQKTNPERFLINSNNSNRLFSWLWRWHFNFLPPAPRQTRLFSCHLFHIHQCHSNWNKFLGFNYTFVVLNTFSSIQWTGSGHPPRTQREKHIPRSLAVPQTCSAQFIWSIPSFRLYPGSPRPRRGPLPEPAPPSSCRRLCCGTYTGTAGRPEPLMSAQWRQWPLKRKDGVSEEHLRVYGLRKPQ